MLDKLARGQSFSSFRHDKFKMPAIATQVSVHPLQLGACAVNEHVFSQQSYAAERELLAGHSFEA
eukprot:6222-Heterococcus_DN1.PRE.2